MTVSIINQKKLLEDYAKEHGFTNCVHFTDDGWSGANFDRPNWKRMIAAIEAGESKEAPGAIVMADDSGLEVDYLHKKPGIYSARFIGEDISYDIKNQAILDLLAGVPKEKRTARFVCSIAAVLPDGMEFVTRETMEGYIGGKIAGENGFGYDPIFCVEKYGCTTAELSEEQKNEISHRGKALRAMKEKLAKENL